MEKSRALQILQGQLGTIDELKKLHHDNLQFGKWYRDTQIGIEKVFGTETRHLGDFNNIHFSLLIFSDGTQDHDWQRAYLNGLDSATVVLTSMIDEIRNYWEDGQDDDLMASVRENPAQRIERLCHRFHIVARQIKRRYSNRNTLVIDDEYDVQDLLHALLKIDYDDIRAEEYAPSYAGGASRADFLLKSEQIVIEVKKTRPSLGSKQVGEQLLIDIQKYSQHPDCKLLICFVYDPENIIDNPYGLEHDLTGTKDNLEVKTFIFPK